MSHQGTGLAPESVVDVDAVIVGARCAGTAAAAVLARAGWSVLLLDKSALPSETLSSHTMFAGTLDEVRRMGAMPYLERLDPPDIRTMRIYSSADGNDGFFAETSGAGEEQTVTSLRRYLLDQALLECALDAGAEVRTEATVDEVLWRGGRAVGVVYGRGAERVRVNAKLVLGADGQFSAIADLVGASEPYRWSRSPRSAMLQYLYDPAPHEEAATTVHHSRQGSSLAFVFPTAPRGQTIVMFIDDRSVIDDARTDPAAGWQRNMARHPAIRKRFGHATPVEPIRFHDELNSYFRPSSGPGWVLIGDSGHFKDPIIGQGIRDALWGGRTAAEAVRDLRDDPAALDAALRIWEREREHECQPAYMAAVMESRTYGDSDGVIRLMNALDKHQVRLVDALGRRGNDMTTRLRDRALVRALRDAVVTSPTPWRTLSEIVELGGGLLLSGARMRRLPFRASVPHPWEMPVRDEAGIEESQGEVGVEREEQASA